MIRPTTPGFRDAASGSGILVPEDLQDKDNETWTKQERKQLNRAQQFGASHHLTMLLLCQDDLCKEDPRIWFCQDPASGWWKLECHHKGRWLKDV